MTGLSSLRYTLGYADSVLNSQRWRCMANSAAYFASELRAGLHVLDVGCGPGSITLELAQRVRPGRVVGIDIAPEVLVQARGVAARDKIENVEFRQASVYNIRPSLPGQQPQAFDVVHAHQVLMHLPDPVLALREMLEMTRPGGVVAARDGDLGSAIWWPSDPRLDRWLKILRQVMLAAGAQPDAGRQLAAWAHTAGASQVRSSASVWCFTLPSDRAWWGEMWAARMTSSAITGLAIEGGYATHAELSEIAAAWRAWATNPHGWFAITSGEIVWKVPSDGRH